VTRRWREVGFEPPVPRQRRHPSATANYFSEPRRPVFKIELKPRRSAMTLSLPANRCTGHVILGLDRLTRHAAQMDREPELKIIRRAFAKQVMAACGIRNPRVEAAFAAVAREDFLGPGPWQIVRWGGGYRATPECQCRREAARGCMARPAKGGGKADPG
jgi:hypothetical protein